ncbi:hypothetical protein LCGC14_2745930, partial [marine sediment metagenome]
MSWANPFRPSNVTSLVVYRFREDAATLRFQVWEVQQLARREETRVERRHNLQGDAEREDMAVDAVLAHDRNDRRVVGVGKAILHH